MGQCELHRRAVQYRYCEWGLKCRFAATEVVMIFAALVLLFGVPQNDDIAKTAIAAADNPVLVSENIDKDSKSSALLPSMPEPKAVPRAEAAPGEPMAAAFPAVPVRPAAKGIQETARQRKVWYGLAIAGHAGAAFDAWSTRRAITAGVGTEGNPMLRPFAHSGVLFVATQASPLLMDYLGKRMMTSQHKWVRKMWWLPQTAGAGMSFAAGAHNTSLVQ
jgi:hypothetical protein